MRVFAGPNGSGKTTIFEGILKENRVDLGIYVNADEIEAELSKTNHLDFTPFKLYISQDDIDYFFKTSLFSPVKRQEPNLWHLLKVNNNILTISTTVDSYLAADIAQFLRKQLLNNGLSFTYETVMSHEGKIDFMDEAQKSGYRVYLYYIATEDPEININRVKVREAQYGHSVAPEVVRTRYFKSLHLLKSAVKKTNRAYIFDNSGKQAELIVEVTEGVEVTRNETVNVPNWVANYLLQ